MLKRICAFGLLTAATLLSTFTPSVQAQQIESGYSEYSPDAYYPAVPYPTGSSCPESGCHGGSGGGNPPLPPREPTPDPGLFPKTNPTPTPTPTPKFGLPGLPSSDSVDPPPPEIQVDPVVQGILSSPSTGTLSSPSIPRRGF
jgi:hypothetical protein